jgi:hypothetical protein
MNKSLANIIRLITTKGESDFTSSLREELNDRLAERMANVYVNMCESLYAANEEQINESAAAQKIEEKAVATEQKPVVKLIASLQESIRDEKTIVHHFTNGENVMITNEDAHCLVTLHDSLNKMNQEKMRRLVSENYSEYNKILQFSRKHTERTQK